MVRGRIIPTGSIPGFLTHDNYLTTVSNLRKFLYVVKMVKLSIIKISSNFIQWYSYILCVKKTMVMSLRYDPTQHRLFTQWLMCCFLLKFRIGWEVIVTHLFTSNNNHITFTERVEDPDPLHFLAGVWIYIWMYLRRALARQRSCRCPTDRFSPPSLTLSHLTSFIKDKELETDLHFLIFFIQRFVLHIKPFNPKLLKYLFFIILFDFNLDLVTMKTHHIV